MLPFFFRNSFSSGLLSKVTRLVLSCLALLTSLGVKPLLKVVDSWISIQDFFSYIHSQKLQNLNFSLFLFRPKYKYTWYFGFQFLNYLDALGSFSILSALVRMKENHKICKGNKKKNHFVLWLIKPPAEVEFLQSKRIIKNFGKTQMQTSSHILDCDCQGQRVVPAGRGVCVIFLQWSTLSSLIRRKYRKSFSCQVLHLFQVGACSFFEPFLGEGGWVVSLAAWIKSELCAYPHLEENSEFQSSQSALLLKISCLFLILHYIR